MIERFFNSDQSYHAINTAFYVCAYSAALAGALLWVFQSKQVEVERTGKTACLIAFRLAIVFIVIYGFGLLIGCSGFVILTALGLLLLFTLAGSELGFVGFPLLFITQQFVLGFPARRHLVNNATSAPEPVPEPDTARTRSSLIGQQGTARTALRPAGEITLDGKRYEAQSESHRYIDAGDTVVVLDERGGILIVGPVT